MTLQDRAAAALDATHSAPAIVDNVQVERIRSWIAAWLDGQTVRINGIKIKTSLILRSVELLEMIARTGRAA